MRLPVIVGAGGINSAGRGSFDFAYLRTVYPSLDSARKRELLNALASLGCSKDERSALEGSLIRKINPSNYPYFDHPVFLKSIGPAEEIESLRFKRRDAEKSDHSSDIAETDRQGEVSMNVPKSGLFFDARKKMEVSSLGLVPDGFDPSSGYESGNHPRALQLTVHAIHDTILSSGFEAESLRSLVSPNLIGVYSGSSLGQGDSFGYGGFARASLLGSRPSSKQLPFSMPQMAADFINSYVLGNIGISQCNVGACATFLYNLRAAVNDIQRGACRIAIVGCAESPITPEIVRAYASMTALSTDEDLMKLDGLSRLDEIDHSRACRPFGDNRGFVLAESAQFLILMDDQLAIESGATILGSVPCAFTHPDGFKSSISKPGIGNYLSFVETLAQAKAIFGEAFVAEKIAVCAHGTGTPQNRVTESELFSRVAKETNARRWTIFAPKCFLGHSTGPAAGDQIGNTLGIWNHSIIPGIETIEELANDTHQDHLDFCLRHREIKRGDIGAVVINSKGFGGNNGSCLIASPAKTMEIIKGMNPSFDQKTYRRKNEITELKRSNNKDSILSGQVKPNYNTSSEIKVDELEFDGKNIHVKGYTHSFPVNNSNPYKPKSS